MLFRSTVQAIRAGEVNWMTAGRGITHSERFEKARLTGDNLHGIQCWVALPEADEETAPAFVHHAMEDLPLIEDKGIVARLIAGRAHRAQSPVRTHSPLFYLHWTMAAGARGEVPADYPERAAYVATGRVEIAGETFSAGQMILFKPEIGRAHV